MVQELNNYLLDGDVITYAWLPTEHMEADIYCDQRDETGRGIGDSIGE